jgi:hypothetical protein
MKLDMHLHSNHSSDGKESPKNILKHARKLGLGGVCITDHNTLSGNAEARKIAGDYGILVIRGMEISSTGGHILGIGIDSEVPRNLSPEETLARIHEAGGIAVVPHPFRQWTGLGDAAVRAMKPDAIEVLNSHSTARDNEMARALCNELKLPMTAGSDAHDIRMIGKAGISIPEVSSEEEALECILHGKAKTLGKSRGLPGALKDRTITITNWIARGFKQM